MTLRVTFPRVALILGAAATTTPIFGGYVVGMLLLGWLVVTGRRAEPTTPLEATLKDLLRPIDLGVLVLVACHFAAALLGWLTSPFAGTLYEAAHTAVRMAIKWGLLWFVIAHGMRLAARRGWAPREIGFWLAGFMLINVAYAFVQRYTGIDWTHGVGTQLPPNRFAYGVYRINGFMGHPLTLAYNLMLMICAAGALLFPLRQNLDGKERLAWWIVAAAATLELLISGSRFVLLVIPAVLVVQAGRRIVPYLKWIVPAAVAIAAFLWWEGSIVGRFGEIFDQNVPLTERFPRLVFWKLHWQMFTDHPLAGVSLAGADRAMDAYFSAIGRRDIVNTAHNVFLQALADSGLVGFVGLLGLLAGLCLSASRARRLLTHASGLGLLVTATVLSGLMQNNLRDSEFLYALWFFLALVLLRVASLATKVASERERKPLKDQQPATDRPDP